MAGGLVVVMGLCALAAAGMNSCSNTELEKMVGKKGTRSISKALARVPGKLGQMCSGLSGLIIPMMVWVTVHVVQWSMSAVENGLDALNKGISKVRGIELPEAKRGPSTHGKHGGKAKGQAKGNGKEKRGVKLPDRRGHGLVVTNTYQGDSNLNTGQGVQGKRG